MDFYNTKFYDEASSEYSQKRYQDKPESYIQFFFKLRLDILLKFIDLLTEDRENLTLLDIGCADGVVINKTLKIFLKTFSRCVGVDISPKMIETARKNNTYKNVSYYMENTEEKGFYDIILATGFLSPGIFDEKFSYIKKHMHQESFFICSLASRNSLYAMFKLKNKEYSKDYWDYPKYEEYLKKDFEIVDSYSYGFFVPKLWKLPWLARIVQPIIEMIMNYVYSGSFQEKLYVLRKR